MGSYGEPMGRDGLQDLWQRYDIAVFGHIHGYERTCPVYQAKARLSLHLCIRAGESKMIWIITAGGAVQRDDPCHRWLRRRREPVYVQRQCAVLELLQGRRHLMFGKLTAINSSFLLFEYKKSRDGHVYDRFSLARLPSPGGLLRRQLPPKHLGRLIELRTLETCVDRYTV